VEFGILVVVGGSLAMAVFLLSWTSRASFDVESLR
jgi:hypothetical protein